MTFKDLSQTYFDNYKLSVKEITYKTKMYIFQRALENKALWEMKIEDIILDDLLQLQKELLFQYTNNTVRNIYYQIINIFELAVNKNLIYPNPALSVKNVQRENRKRSIHVINKEQFQKLIEYIDEDSYQESIFLQLLFHTGLRHSEARALLWADINFEEKTLTVNKSIYCTRFEEYTLTDAKTIASNRTIELDNKILNRLEYLKFISVYNDNTDFIFNEFGFPYPQHFAKVQLKKACKECNINVSAHGLRHSHATYLLRNKIDAQRVSKRLGHSNPAFTLSVYIHLIADDNKEIIKLFE